MAKALLALRLWQGEALKARTLCSIIYDAMYSNPALESSGPRATVRKAVQKHTSNGSSTRDSLSSANPSRYEAITALPLGGDDGGSVLLRQTDHCKAG